MPVAAVTGCQLQQEKNLLMESLIILHFSIDNIPALKQFGRGRFLI